LDTLLALADTLLFGALILALVLGISFIVMACFTGKSGAEAYKERIEYGFFGVTSLGIMGLLAYLIA
jgi:hypothetical protein